MQIIGATILDDSYEPARRAAVLVVTQIIQGFDKLQDFETILLPVFRSLKYVLANVADEPTRKHAANGLRALQTKVVAFLQAPVEPKEIQIVGVVGGGGASNKKNPGILELN